MQSLEGSSNEELLASLAGRPAGARFIHRFHRWHRLLRDAGGGLSADAADFRRDWPRSTPVPPVFIRAIRGWQLRFTNVGGPRISRMGTDPISLAVGGVSVREADTTTTGPSWFPSLPRR